VYLSHLPVVLKAPLWLLTGAWRKLIEITTGISLPRDASIGGGLYIGHFGGIIVHGSAVLGRGCNVSQGVTIGVSGHGEQRGVPVIGDNVGIAANAVVAGKIHIGDRVSVSACSLVTSDVPADCVVRGVPGIVIGTRHRDS
jgi:serine O-acetyltransferase